MTKIKDFLKELSPIAIIVYGWFTIRFIGTFILYEMNPNIATYNDFIGVIKTFAVLIIGNVLIDVVSKVVNRNSR